jgi:Asp/Glu/hydantoin racemase
MNTNKKGKKVGFLHTTPATIGMAEKYMKLYLPGVEFVHIYDGNMKVDNFSSPINVTPKINMLRYANYAHELEQSGCDVVVSCCSLMRRAVAFAGQIVSIPVIQLDAVILNEAAENYNRIGVINTTAYVVPYIEEQLKNIAAELNKEIEIIFSNNVTALELFNKGEYDKYEAIVIEDMKKLDEQGVDCILMGQIPFAMMEDKIKEQSFRAPVLYAGYKAFKRIEELLG